MMKPKMRRGLDARLDRTACALDEEHNQNSAIERAQTTSTLGQPTLIPINGLDGKNLRAR
jgi:hypothetical protein